MRTVKEVSKLSGVSVRTLHHYDAIGLLKPTAVTASGYRLYDDTALRRLQSILLFRELGFPLKEIRTILDRPGFDQRAALEPQIHLLELQQKRLGELITFARELQQSGGISMDFTAFDQREIDEYAAEAKARWGHTKAYQEYEQKTQGQSAQQLRDTGNQLMDLFRDLGAQRPLAPDSAEAQTWVQGLRDFITAHYYTCTKEILAGLGQMYTQGAMQENIDAAGGPGTAECAAQAIAVYCGR